MKSSNSCPIKFILEERCVKLSHSLSSVNLIISNIVKSSCDNCYPTFGHMHNSNPDLLLTHYFSSLP